MKKEFYSFSKWKEAYPEIVAEAQPETETCPVCDDGMHYCECGSVHTCHFCNGTGKVGKTKDEVLMDMYYKQLKHDQDLVKKFIAFAAVQEQPNA